MRNLAFFAMFAVIGTLMISNSYAAEITIDTNKETFAGGDTVEISGMVENGIEGELVALEVKDPAGETILIRTATLGPGGSYELKFKIPKSSETGSYDIVANAEVDGKMATSTKTITQSSQQATPTGSSGSGGCLIATATYGSELAPQVQMLREIRDNSLLQTQSGQAFMQSFNEFYYSFSPVIADYERENPVFREAVKLAITPMITSLSILNYVELDSEFDILSYGISLILLNVGMYFVAPVIVIMKLRKEKWRIK